MIKLRNIVKKHQSIVIISIALIIAGCNYLVYPLFIQSQLKLQDVYVAFTEIPPNTKIEETMIQKTSIPVSLISDRIVIRPEDIIGKYTKESNAISEGSYFYKTALSSEKEIMGKTASILQKDETAYVLSVDTKYVEAENLKAGQYIDLYFLTYIEENKNTEALIGLLAEHLYIVDITISENQKQQLTLAVNEEDISYLLYAEETGTIYPLLSYDATNRIQTRKSIYDVIGLRSILDNRMMTIRK